MGGTALKRYKIVVSRTATGNWEFTIVAGNGTKLAKSLRTYGEKRDAVRAARSLVAADLDLDDIVVVES